MIEQPTVDRVIEAAQSRIVDIVSDFVSLRKRGVNYIGNCPFHNEKTPSFSVSPTKGIFKCFGCGKAGNAVHFLMEHEQLSWLEAIKMLGKKFGIPIEEKVLTPEDLIQQSERESMMIVTEFASKYFSRMLYESDEGISVGLGYFRKRGFRDDIIKKFELGYSPAQKDALTKEAQKNGYKIEFLEKTGLAIVGDNYTADRFRERVMFPIHNLTGKVIAFGGRIMKSDAKTAKYLNSPESEIYHKSRILYGIYQARQEIIRQDRVLLVEGYTDVLSFHQAGIANVVASSGTSLTVDQIRLMARFSPNITIIYDGDTAGIKASLRGIDLVLEEGMNVKVLLLPDGEDPDSFAQKTGGDALRDYIQQNETDFIKFKTSLLLDESKNDPIKRAQLIQDIVRSIATIPDHIMRSVYIKECSALMRVDEPVLYNEIKKIDEKRKEKDATRTFVRTQPDVPATDTSTAPVFTITNPFETEEREIMRYLISYGEHPLGEIDTEQGRKAVSVGEYIVSELKSDDLKSLNPVHNQVLQLYEEHADDPDFVASKFFINHSDTEVSRLASNLLAHKHTLSKIHKRTGIVKETEELLVDIVPRVVIELKWKMVKVRFEQCCRRLKKSEEEKDDAAMLLLMQEMLRLQNALKVISLQQGERTIIY
ncbi:MAG: DNA primase [Cytophagaceae bacterium]|jgi:DNA primase|nr:DNA primase [Cytophagaceae bacterium]